MTTNVRVDKKEQENNVNLIRRFTRRVQKSGVLSRVRSIRYSDRIPSEYVKKKIKLKSLNRKAEIEHLIKLGKMPENPQRRYRR